MDLCNFEYITPLLTLLICAPIALFLAMFRPSGRRRQNLPPGNTGWPIIGESLDFALSHRSGKPESFIRTRMTKLPSARVFRTSLFGENMAVFCDAGGNKFLFSNENKMVTAWWPGNIRRVLGFPTTAEVEEEGGRNNEDVIKDARGFFIEYLQPESLRRYLPIMDAAAKLHVEEQWISKREVAALEMVKDYTFKLSCNLFMRIEDPAHIARLAAPLRMLTAGMVCVPVNFPGTTFHKAIKAGKEIQDEVLAIVTKRKAELKAAALEGQEVDMTDLLTKMLMAVDEDGKPLCHKQIAAMIVGLFLASHDTTTSVISCTLSYLSDLPHIYDKVYQEQMEILKEKDGEKALNWDDVQKMRYTWNVVSEVMRLAPPAQGTFREALHNFDFEGFTIPRGWKAYWSVHSTHKDPKYFPDPEKFEPERFDGSGPAPYTFVPFGGGPRMCPGRFYARLEVLSLLHNLVVNFRWKKSIPDEGIAYTTSAFPAKGLPISLQPHDKN